MSSISESYSLHSLSLPQSVRSETKDKFDAILKTALRKKRSNSKEQLLDTSATSSSRRSLLDLDEEKRIRKIEEAEERASKELILNKFLNDSNSLELSNASKNTVVTLVKPPVPRPRKKKLLEERRDSVDSTGTFNVTSPKILLDSDKNAFNKSDEILRRDSISSVRTFDITSPKVIPKYSTSEIDNDKNVQVIGDLVLHESPTTSKITIFASQNDALEKADNETLVDRNSSKSSSSRGTFILNRDNDIEKGLHTDIMQNVLPTKVITNKLDTIETKHEVKSVKPTAKKRVQKKTRNSEIEDHGDEIPQVKSKDAQPYDYQYITEIKIHKTDTLLLNSFVIHPVVKIHIVDIRTGTYLKKSDKNRPVVFYYENDNNDYILPVMSSYYNLQEKRSFYPMWEETILLNEDFNYLINEHVIIFFEIMDFSTKNFGTLKKNNEYEKGWYKIAFAFLKVVGKNNTQNVNKKVRLQLYYPLNMNSKKLEHNACQVWDWWQSKNLKKYPSTLYITIRGVISPTRVIETFRSKTPLQKEIIDTVTVEEPNNDNKLDEQIKQDADNFKLKWQKIIQKDKTLPEKCVFQLDTYEEGCFVLKFSHNGLYLACSFKINDDFQIVIYMVKNFEEIFRYKSHQALIYSITWSNDDKYILSTSSDNTAAIWNFKNKTFMQILPHPSFVYTGEINSENNIATGCYDNILRIWNFNKETLKFELHQELDEHKGFVTSLCFSRKNTGLLYSADSCGKILEWNKTHADWVLKRKLDIVDLRETKINQIMLFAKDRKMLVHSRDSALRIISVLNVCVIYWLHGALNTRVQTFCDISHKWSYVAAGSENGLVIVWDAKTGKYVKTYEGFSNKYKSTHSVQFHPNLNMLAMSHYGSNEPVLIYFTEENNAIQNIQQEGKIETKVYQDSEIKIDTKSEKFDFRRVLEKMDQLLA